MQLWHDAISSFLTAASEKKSFNDAEIYYAKIVILVWQCMVCILPERKRWNLLILMCCLSQSGWLHHYCSVLPRPIQRQGVQQASLIILTRPSRLTWSFSRAGLGAERRNLSVTKQVRAVNCYVLNKAFTYSFLHINVIWEHIPERGGRKKGNKKNKSSQSNSETTTATPADDQFIKQWLDAGCYKCYLPAACTCRSSSFRAVGLLLLWLGCILLWHTEMSCGVHLGYVFAAMLHVFLAVVAVPFFWPWCLLFCAGSYWLAYFKQSMYAVYGLNKVNRIEVFHVRFALWLTCCGFILLFPLQLKAPRDKTATDMLASCNSTVDEAVLVAAFPRINSDRPQPKAVALTQTLQPAVAITRDSLVVAKHKLFRSQFTVATPQLGWCKATLCQNLTGKLLSQIKQMQKRSQKSISLALVLLLLVVAPSVGTIRTRMTIARGELGQISKVHSMLTSICLGVLHLFRVLLAEEIQPPNSLQHRRLPVLLLKHRPTTGKEAICPWSLPACLAQVLLCQRETLCGCKHQPLPLLEECQRVVALKHLNPLVSRLNMREWKMTPARLRLENNTKAYYFKQLDKVPKGVTSLLTHPAWPQALEVPANLLQGPTNKMLT